MHSMFWNLNYSFVYAMRVKKQLRTIKLFIKCLKPEPKSLVFRHILKIRISMDFRHWLLGFLRVRITHIFDCCKQSLNRLWSPSIHPSIHPVPYFFAQKKTGEDLIFFKYFFFKIFDCCKQSLTQLWRPSKKGATGNLLYKFAPNMCKSQDNVLFSNFFFKIFYKQLYLNDILLNKYWIWLILLFYLFNHLFFINNI